LVRPPGHKRLQVRRRVGLDPFIEGVPFVIVSGARPRTRPVGLGSTWPAQATAGAGGLQQLLVSIVRVAWTICYSFGSGRPVMVTQRRHGRLCPAPCRKLVHLASSGVGARCRRRWPCGRSPHIQGRPARDRHVILIIWRGSDGASFRPKRAFYPAIGGGSRRGSDKTFSNAETTSERQALL